MKKLLVGSVVGVLALVAAGSFVRAQSEGPPKAGPHEEWRSYGADLASTRYRPLDQINKDNFDKLEVAWRFKTDNLGPRAEFNFQSTPLMVGGWLYTTAGTRRAVVALDAATGEMKWMHSEDEGKRGEEAPRQLSGRGLAYWSDGRSARIIYVTPGYRMKALDARTGAPDHLIRKERRRRSEARERSGHGPDHRRHRIARSAGHCPGRRHYRRGAYRGQPAGEPPERERLRARIRRAHGPAAVDLPHDSRAGRVRRRDVGEGLLVVHRQHRRLGSDERGRGARYRLPAR